MITREQLINGFIQYIDDEVIPSLPTSSKWCIGTAITIIMPKANQLLDDALKMPILKTLDLVSPEGLIDEEKILTALAANAKKYGKMEVAIPIIGKFTFSCEDIASLKKHVGG